MTAVEPGEQLIARARDQLEDSGEVQFVNKRLEESSLPNAHYPAVFFAAAIHWVDPAVSWKKAADTLADGGTLALISYFGLDDPRSSDDQHALRAAIARIAPELAGDWPRFRELDSILEAVARRRNNVSAVWAWLGSYGIARADSAADPLEHSRVPGHGAARAACPLTD